MPALPLVNAAADSALAWRDGAPLTVEAFLTRVGQVARRLPNKGAVINLCEDRHRFLLGFAAALSRGLPTLLPPNRSEQSVAALRADHPGSLTIDDAWIDATPADGAGAPVTAVPADRVAAVLYTSGSTGAPQPHTKRWGELVEGARLARRQLPFPEGRCHILATVPPQHMFGLETTILLPMATGACIDTSRPFFPADVQARLAALPEPRVLVTTPLHLKTCLDAALPWPRIEFVLSATAPLSAELAARAEAQWGAPVMEIYGSTETGAMATRRTATDDAWRPLPGVRVSQDGERGYADIAHLARRQPLNDFVEPAADGRFRLLGRTADLINIAGKRASLGDLNLKLTAIPGVRDGVFVMPEESGEITRLIALVVAPDLDDRTLLAHLRRAVDPVFLPRPVYRLDKLPRTEAGKLPRQALLDLVRELDKK